MTSPEFLFKKGLGQDIIITPAEGYISLEAFFSYYYLLFLNLLRIVLLTWKWKLLRVDSKLPIYLIYICYIWLQIDAAINSGNSGGPALQDDKVIGIAFETLDNAENIGYIIPVRRVWHVFFCLQSVLFTTLLSNRSIIPLSVSQTFSVM